MYAFFGAWFLLLNTEYVRFTLVVVEIVVRLFSVLSSILLYEYTTVYLSIQL